MTPPADVPILAVAKKLAELLVDCSPTDTYFFYEDDMRDVVIDGTVDLHRVAERLIEWLQTFPASGK